MSKKILFLDETSLKSLINKNDLPESGMDYYCIKGVIVINEISSVKKLFIVRSNGFIFPENGEDEYYGINNSSKALPSNEIESDEIEIDVLNILFDEIEIDSLNNLNLKHLNKLPITLNYISTVNLPSGYVPTTGAHNLLGSITLKSATQFFRYTSSQKDLRFTSSQSPIGNIPNTGELSAGTYMTTQKDDAFVNTGFGAVGRFALPMPIPASYRHDYTVLPQINSPIKLDVGTVAPAFGQSGGGIEVKTTSKVDVIHNGTVKIDDC